MFGDKNKGNDSYKYEDEVVVSLIILSTTASPILKLSKIDNLFRSIVHSSSTSSEDKRRIMACLCKGLDKTNGKRSGGEDGFAESVCDVLRNTPVLIGVKGGSRGGDLWGGEGV